MNDFKKENPIKDGTDDLFKFGNDRHASKN